LLISVGSGARTLQKYCAPILSKVCSVVET
jgi:hypothetical protein